MNYSCVDFDSIYNELLKYHLGSEYYPIADKSDFYKTDKICASTLDEYLMSLIRGYINIELPEDLNKHLMEVLEDDWFLKWPLVQWAYWSRTLYGIGRRKNVKQSAKNLIPMAKAGNPGALFDIGYCHRYSGGLEINYDRGICLWIEASKRGYRKAWEELYREYEIKTYRNLGDELKLFFLFEIFSHFLEYKDLSLEEGLDNIDEQDRLELKKIYNEGKRLQKTVFEKANLRSLTALFWDVDEGPYKIDF